MNNPKEEKSQTQESVSRHLGRIDHMAIAVPDLAEALHYYQHVLGFELESELATKGSKSGMISAVVRAAEFSIVLIQGTEPESQVSRFVERHGAGVQHIAFEVDNLEKTKDELEGRGQEFVTTIINGPGLKQLFTTRDKSSGMMFEYIERTDNEGFSDDSVADLFRQMEEADAV